MMHGQNHIKKRNFRTRFQALKWTTPYVEIKYVGS